MKYSILILLVAIKDLHEIATEILEIRKLLKRRRGVQAGAKIGCPALRILVLLIGLSGEG